MPAAMMIGGVFLLSREPRRLADWYRDHLGWKLSYLEEDDTYYAELYYREDDQARSRRHLVYAIMPGDPGVAGTGHIINYRVDCSTRKATALSSGSTSTKPRRLTIEAADD
jgi:catechol 2,3-dioxygenase-like lactoylglutathione lyase family enzyme